MDVAARGDIVNVPAASESDWQSQAATNAITVRFNICSLFYMRHSIIYPDMHAEPPASSQKGRQLSATGNNEAQRMALIWFHRTGEHGNDGNDDSEARHHEVIRKSTISQSALCITGPRLYIPGERRRSNDT